MPMSVLTAVIIWGLVLWVGGGVYCIAVNSAVISMHGTLCTCCIINKQCVDMRAHAGIRARHEEETQTIPPPVSPVIAPPHLLLLLLLLLLLNFSHVKVQVRIVSSSSWLPRHSDVSGPGMGTARRGRRVGPRDVTA